MDVSDYYTQLAIQGPRAKDTLQKLTKVDLAPIKNYWFTWGEVAGCHNVLIARTGYTGEDGFRDLHSPPTSPPARASGASCWPPALSSASFPCGLGSRNTLRLEAAMALYGHEISDTINVLEANLGPLLQIRQGHRLRRPRSPPGRRRRGRPRAPAGWRLEMVGRGIGRDGHPVFTPEGKPIGEITSGSPGPFIKKNIALAYVPTAYTEIGTTLAVEIRGQLVEAVVVPTPLLQAAQTRRSGHHRAAVVA